MRKATTVVTLFLVMVLSLSAAALAADAMTFDVRGGYLFGNYDDGAKAGAPGFFFGASTDITDLIGARFNYGTFNIAERNASFSTMDILGTYKVTSTEKYTLLAVGGLKTMNDGTYAGTLEASGIALGAELTAPINDMLTVYGTFLLVPSCKMKLGAAEVTGSGNKLEISGKFTVPGLPVKVIGGYRSDSYAHNADKGKVSGLFVGAQTTF